MYKAKEIVCLQMGSRLCNGGIEMSKIAFIGTGIIGAGLAVNALAAGNECTLCNKKKKKETSSLKIEGKGS